MNTRILAFLFFAVAAAVASCNRNDAAPATTITTLLNVVNATADTIKYYVNDTREYNYSDIYVGGQTGYQYVPFGTQNYKVSDATGTFPVLFAQSYTLTDSSYYSLFVCGATSDKAFVNLDQIPAENTLVAADTTGTVSLIRFVNTSPAFSSLSVTVGLGDTINVTGAAFKYVGPFTKFTAGSKEIKVFLPGSATPAIDTNITLAVHGVYTLFTQGQLNGKGTSAFGITLMNNY